MSKSYNNSNQAKVGIQGDGLKVHGDCNVDLSTSVHHHNNWGTLKEDTGKIGYFNFDLQSLQGMIVADRSKELCEIREALAKDTTSGARIAILVGMGGAGKTTTARLYTKLKKDQSSNSPFFENLIWVEAEDPKYVTLEFKRILKERLRMHFSGTTDQQLSDFLYNVILKYKTLLVFDNVEDVEAIRNFLPNMTTPEAPPPHVIITTRRKSGWEDYEDHMVPIRELTLETCEVYIRENLAKSPLKIPDVDYKWKELAEHFGCLMIGLRAATMNIVEQNRRHKLVHLEVYTLDMFLKQVLKQNVLERAIGTNHPEKAEDTYKHLRGLWTLTLDGLNKRSHGQLAEQILQVLAYMASEGVPVWWIKFFCIDCLDPDRKNFMGAVHLLTSLSLVDHTGEKYVVHRVLQEALLKRFKSVKEKRIEIVDWLLPALEKLFQTLPDNCFFEDMDINVEALLGNMEAELIGNVPDSVVSFLICLQRKVPFCVRPVIEQVQKISLGVLDGNVFVSRESLQLLSAADRENCKSNILLLPSWIRECSGQMCIHEQLKFASGHQRWLKRAFEDISNTELARYLLLKSYMKVSELFHKWDLEIVGCCETSSPAKTAQVILEALGDICKGLRYCISKHKDVEFTIDKIDELCCALSKVKSGIAAALKVVMDEPVHSYEDLGAKFRSCVRGVEHWWAALNNTHYALLKEFEVIEELVEEALEVLKENLDGVLVQAGVDVLMLGWYQVQLERFFGGCGGPKKNKRYADIDWEPRIVAGVMCFLNKCFSGLKHSVGIGNSCIEPLFWERDPMIAQCLLLVHFQESPYCRSKLSWYRNSSLHAYLIYMGIEPHLKMLDEKLESMSEDYVLKFHTSYEVFAYGMEKAIKVDKELRKQKTKSLLAILSLIASQPAVQGLLPNIEKFVEFGYKVILCFEKIQNKCILYSPASPYRY